MKRYMITCPNGDCRGIDGTNYAVQEVGKIPILIIYVKADPIAYFREWIYVTIE